MICEQKTFTQLNLEKSADRNEACVRRRRLAQMASRVAARNRAKPMIGKAFSAWTVIGQHGEERNWKYQCRCICGTIKTVAGSSLRAGTSKGCGCTKAKANNLSRTPEYTTWTNMKRRCRQDSPDAKNYFKRGIKVCSEWSNQKTGFMAFLQHVGRRPQGCSLDRVNNDGNYEPGNVRWATTEVQIKNQRPRKLITDFTTEELLEELAKRNRA